MKHFIHLILCMIILLGNVVISNAEYFNEDWVWTYSQPYDKTDHCYQYRCKFCGTTEIDSVVWHNFTVIGYDAIYGPTHEINSYEGLRSTFLIREQDKVFYVRMPEEETPDIHISAFPWKPDKTEEILGQS